MTQIISIVGKSNSGKTTFIEKLIPELKNKGYKIGVIKHSHHAFDIDKKGKDSFRHQQAGADTVIVASAGKFAMVKQVQSEPSLDELQEYFADMDLIITEGYKKENKAKIEIFREAAHDALLCTENDNLIALVTDSAVSGNVPVFGLQSYKAVANFIEETFLNSK